MSLETSGQPPRGDDLPPARPTPTAPTSGALGDAPTANPAARDGGLAALEACGGFILFWIAIAATIRAKNLDALLSVALLAFAIGIVALFRPRLRGLGIGLLFGFLLVAGGYFLLQAIFGGKSFIDG